MEMNYRDKLFPQLSSPNCPVRKDKIALHLHPRKGFLMRYSAGPSCSVFSLEDPECKGILK